MVEPGSLEGVLVAMVTPVTGAGSIDPDAAGRLASGLVERGVRGVCPAGTTGEGPSLPLADRLALVAAVASSVPAGTPVVPGVFQDSVLDTLREVEAYAEQGAAGVLVAPPHYYVLVPDDVQRFYEQVADASSLPLIAYNIPSFTKNPVPPAALARLADHPRVVGVKDSSRDMEYLLGVLDALGEAGVGPDRFAVATGTDTMLLTSLSAGARGAIVASANVAPELCRGAFDAYRAGEAAAARAFEVRLRRLVAACRTGSYPAGWKAAAAALGLCEPWMVPPRAALAEAARLALKERLQSLELGATGS